METEASSSSNKKNEKIGKVLEKFLQPNFKITNEVYVNLFITHLVDKNDDAYIWQTNEQLKEQFCEWIIEASNLWDHHKVNPQGSVLSFALSLASQLSAEEQVFVRLNCQNVYEGLVGLAQTNSMKDPTGTLGLFSLLCSFLEHKSGLQWVMATPHWTGMINLGLKAHSPFIRKKAYQFVIKLLEKTISFNRNFGVKVVALLIKPLKDILRSLPCDQNTQLKEINSKELFERLKPSLNLILEIVETMLRNFNRNVIELFLEQKTVEAIEQFLRLSRNEDFSFELLRIEFLFLFNRFVAEMEGKKVLSHEALPLFSCNDMLELIKNEMAKDNVRSIVKICDYSTDVFNSLAHRMPKVIKKGCIIEFQTQMMFLQIMPIFSFSIQMRSADTVTSVMLNDVFRNVFFHNWLKISTTQSIEMSYKWVDDLTTKHDLVDDVIFCLEYIVKMKRLLNKERAAYVFSALVYSLTDAISCLNETPEGELSSSCFLYLKKLTETVIDLVESFDLTWKESVETICVLDLAYDFVVYPDWTDEELIVKGLKLLNTAISKYMSPDMVLLIYHTEDSKVSQTGSLLYTKCHDSSSEIRDNALMVVYTLSLNANTKFPAYTHILLKAKLPQLVVDMALKDSGYFVRATAFKCLQEMIQIPEIWNILSNVDLFLDKMLDAFENETEGMVRKEAATLICKIDKYQNFPEENLPRLYDVMTHAAIGDLYCDVKYCALDFWFNLWEQHLIHQGMIDHAFPSHTFSKEHKKIVALNDQEVRKRIIKVLNQLGHVGCLHVMKCAVQNDYDIEVSKKAISFTFEMLKILKIYKINCENVDLSQPPSPAILQKSLPKVPSIKVMSSVSLPNEPFIEPMSPADSGTMTAPSSPANLKDFDNPQFSNSPSFDPITFSPGPLSSSLDIDDKPPAPTASQFSIIQHSPQKNNSSPNGSSVDHTDSSGTRSDTPFSNTFSNQITSSLNLTNGTEGCGYEEDSAELENILSDNSHNQECGQEMLDEILKLTDMTLLQGLYNPTDQIINGTRQVKTYLAPSQYLKFIYTEIESYTMEKKWPNNTDVFDSLLDDILKEYHNVADINNMDCF